MNRFKAVIFDVDGTLTDHNSWYAFTRDIGGSETEHHSIYERQRGGKLGFDEAKQRLLKMWQETEKANRDHITSIFRNWPIRKEAYPLVEWLKEEGYIVCLITGSVKIYAEIVAEKLGINNYYANADLYFDKDGILNGFHYDTDQAKVKLEQFKDFCHKYNLKPSECMAIGDGDNDIELFRITGNGILIDYEEVAPELHHTAWKTISTLADVRPLLES